MGYKCGVKHLTLGDTNCARGQVAELYEASCRSSYWGGSEGGNQVNTRRTRAPPVTPRRRSRGRGLCPRGGSRVWVGGSRLGARRRQCSWHRARRQAVQGVDRARGDRGSLSGFRPEAARRRRSAASCLQAARRSVHQAEPGCGEPLHRNAGVLIGNWGWRRTKWRK